MNIIVSIPTVGAMPTPEEYEARGRAEREMTLPTGRVTGRDQGNHSMCIFIDGVADRDAETVASSAVQCLLKCGLLDGLRLNFNVEAR